MIPRPTLANRRQILTDKRTFHFLTYTFSLLRIHFINIIQSIAMVLFIFFSEYLLVYYFYYLYFIYKLHSHICISHFRQFFNVVNIEISAVNLYAFFYREYLISCSLCLHYFRSKVYTGQIITYTIIKCWERISL